jgi:hypothetical protein
MLLLVFQARRASPFDTGLPIASQGHRGALRTRGIVWLHELF